MKLVFCLRFCLETLASTAGANASNPSMIFQWLYDLDWWDWPGILLQHCPSAVSGLSPAEHGFCGSVHQLKVPPLSCIASSSLLHTFMHPPAAVGMWVCNSGSFLKDCRLSNEFILRSFQRDTKTGTESDLPPVCPTATLAPAQQAILCTQPWVYNLLQIWVDQSMQAHPWGTPSPFQPHGRRTYHVFWRLLGQKGQSSSELELSLWLMLDPTPPADPPQLHIYPMSILVSICTCWLLSYHSWRPSTTSIPPDRGCFWIVKEIWRPE